MIALPRAVPRPRLSAGALGLAALLVVAYGIVPRVGTSYLFEALLTPFLALALAGLGLNLLTGYAGLLSLGSAAFMAVGASAGFNPSLRPPGPAPPAGGLLAGPGSALSGRVRGPVGQT